MRAWTLEESPGTYRLGEVPVPQPGPGEVRIEVRASALNHIDLWLTRGQPRPPSFPHIPGSDAAGVIDAVGPGVTRWSPGDEVVMEAAVTTEEAIHRRGIDSVEEPGLHLLGEHRWGGHAQYVVVPHWHPVPKPATRSWIECAAYPVAYVTAWRMLRLAGVGAGSRVLVVGIGGGVATAALILARRIGAAVEVTSRNADKLDRAVKLGASGTHDTAGPFPRGFDAVIDTVGGPVFEPALRALRSGGAFVTCGATAGVEVNLNIPYLFFRQLRIQGVTLGSHQEFCQVTELVAEGLPVVIDTVLPFEQYPVGLDLLASGEQLGKIVLDHGVGATGER